MKTESIGAYSNNQPYSQNHHSYLPPGIFETGPSLNYFNIKDFIVNVKIFDFQFIKAQQGMKMVAQASVLKVAEASILDGRT